MAPPSTASGLRSSMALAAGNAQNVPQYDVNLLPLIPPDKCICLRFDGVDGWVPGRFQPPTTWETVTSVVKRMRGDSEARATGPRKQILYHVTGEVNPGEVLALMGPSGSGKTSLLTTLAGRVPKLMDISGSILFNGKPMLKATKRLMGYVLQDDLLYATLTVYETLLFAALLRLPSEMPRAEKEERVDVVLAALGLQTCRETLIGSPARRGVSGGERKRVSVGHELLINPSILMLDEPTSGLDSTTAMHLMTLLRALSGGNRSIITTIHQPSSRLYQQLDKLLLLSGGHVMYYGAAAEVADWFSKLGFPVPFGVNIADFILDLAMGEAVSTDGAVTGADAVRSMYATFEQFSFKTHGSGYFKGSNVDGLQLLLPNDDSFTSPATPSPGSSGRGFKKVASNKELVKMHSVIEDDPAAANGNGHSHHNDGDAATSVLEGLSGAALSHVMLSGVPVSTSSSPSVHIELAHDAANGSGPYPNHHHAAVASPIVGGGSSGVPVSSPSGGNHHTASPASYTSSVPSSPGPSGRVGSSNGSQVPLVAGQHFNVMSSVAENGSGGFASAGADVEEGSKPKSRQEAKGGAKYWEQVGILLLRCSKVKRFEAYSLQEVSKTVFISVLCGMFWWQRGNKGTVESAIDATGLIFFAVIFPSISCAFAALFTFPADYRMLVKERASGMYRLSAFYLARTLTDAPMECLLPTLFFTICWWMGGLRADGGVFISSLLSVLLLVLVSQSFGLLLGGTFMDPKTAMTFATIIIISFFLLAGFFVRDIPVWIAWSKYISFVYWAYDLVMKIHWSGVTLEDCTSGVCEQVTDLNTALKLNINIDASVWLNIVVLFAMLFALRGAIFWVLRYKTSQ